MAILYDVLDHKPTELAFGTSGLRGPVDDMTDLECYINTRGFISFLETQESLKPSSTIYIGGDLRPSTPRIMASVYKAILDEGHVPINTGTLPTPALMNYSLSKRCPSIMITGSHIPSDRNGIKFNKTDGEVLKSDEGQIKLAVAKLRRQIYTTELSSSIFDISGYFKKPVTLSKIDPKANVYFLKRYTNVFSKSLLKGKHIVVYQHSSVGRDLLVEILEKLGARVTPVGRSNIFIPIDTENVTQEDQEYFRKLASNHSDAFAIISVDGDADRPFVVDETGTFHRGDTLGAVVAEWLQADYAAVPISASDAIERYLSEKKIELVNTKIGSPYVIAKMEEAKKQGNQRVTGWEVNGGFLLGTSITIGNGSLDALPTRDSFLPILGILSAAIEVNLSLSTLFKQLPARFTSAGIVDNIPTTVSQSIVEYFLNNNEDARIELEKYFTKDLGFETISDINTVDGLRIFFDNGEIAHLRPSGNAPQCRLYSVADTQARADEIVHVATREPDGIIRLLKRRFS